MNTQNQISTRALDYAIRVHLAEVAVADAVAQPTADRIATGRRLVDALPRLRQLDGVFGLHHKVLDEAEGYDPDPRD